MALESIRFAYVTEGDRRDAVEQFQKIEKAVGDSMIGRDYGSGVKVRDLLRLHNLLQHMVG